MKIRSALAITAVCLGAALFWSCSSKPDRAFAAPTPVVPAQKAKPLVAYLNDGNLWTIQSDGMNQRILAAAPEGNAIQDFVWALDGSRIYFSIGLQFFEVVIQTGNVANAGELIAPPGISIDHLEAARDGKTMIVHALDADALPRLLALTIGHRECRELSVDEYNGLIQIRPPVVRAVGELSVSPDARRVLFKSVVGTGEELFVADVETGARVQITNLYELGGFEESVETEGGRRVIEASWSPDGRYVVFNPMQSCSETGLCYGRLYLVEGWGGAQLQLSIDMMVNVPGEWTADADLLVYDDGSRIVATDTNGYPKALSEGNHPKWQPGP
jgi:Tol biopolymer transport system component